MQKEVDEINIYNIGDHVILYLSSGNVRNGIVHNLIGNTIILTEVEGFNPNTKICIDMNIIENFERIENH